MKRTIRVISGIAKFVDKYFTKERLVSLSMLGKIIGLIIALSFAPSTLAESQMSPAPWSTEIQLDTTKSLPLILPKKETMKIELAESNYDRIEREKREKEEAATAEAQNDRKSAKREVISRDYRPASYDPDLVQKRALAKRAAAQYGIDWRVLEAVWEVESGKSWDTTKGSYAGARGPMQFMPSTWRKYALDANGDGSADIYSAEDAVFAAANLLAQSGAASGDINSALLSYNRAQWYVNKVKAVADSIAD